MTLSTILIVIWILTQISLSISFLYNALSITAIIMELSIYNIANASLNFIAWLALFCYYSGAPTRTNIYRSELRKLMLIVTFWSFCRLAKGLISLNNSSIYAQICKELVKDTSESKGQDIGTWIFFILIYILCDIMPLALVLDWSFMKVFTRKLEEEEESDYSQSFVD